MAFAAREVPLPEWSVLELLQFLNESGWSHAVLPQKAAGRLPAYTSPDGEKMYYSHSVEEPRIGRLYLMALAAIERGEGDIAAVRHGQPEKHYSDLLMGGVLPQRARKRARRARDIEILPGDALPVPPPRPPAARPPVPGMREDCDCPLSDSTDKSHCHDDKSDGDAVMLMMTSS